MITHCIFCESEFADPIQPHNRQKICVIFDVSFNGKKLLHDGRICTRCQVQVELIDNAVRLKTEMNQCLQDKLTKHEERVSVSGGAHSNGASCKASPTQAPVVKPEPVKLSPPQTVHKTQSAHQVPVLSPPLQNTPMMASVPTSAEMMAMATMQAALATAPLLTLPRPDQHEMFAESMKSMEKEGVYGGVFMCVHCGKACNSHTELSAHSTVCLRNRGNQDVTAAGCDRCGQSLRHRSPEDRIKHIVQCKGQGLRRGRPSTGIVNCPKCHLSLKNRMNHDRINHVNRCTGSGLKRGRPSMKSVDKFQCGKCNRNLWSKEQLELHVAKCDGSHVERRGRKPGDNSCMVCGENLIYRHILKKHLRQAHGINPQNLDDSVIAAVKNEHSIDELSTPYKRILLNQIQQHLNTSLPTSLQEEKSAEQQGDSEDSLSQSFDSAISHRKKAKPYKYMAMSDEHLPGGHLPAESLRTHVTCDQCNDSFDDQSQYESHICVVSSSTHQEELDTERSEVESDSHRSSPVISEDRDDMDTSVSEGVDDVISAISARAEYKQQSSSGDKPNTAAKGSAIAQVISGLLGANKGASNSPTSALNTPPHRQSITT